MNNQLSNVILNGDARSVLKHIPNSYIDLTVTSPPYDNLRKYNGVGEHWNHETFKEIANELFRVTKEGGVVVWVVNDKTENGSKTGTSFKQALYFMEIGFNLNDTMIWEKTNPMPVVKQPRYNPVFEYMFVFSKGKPKTFNPLMVECKCAGQLYDSTCKNMGGENGRTKKTFNINKEKVKGNIWEIAVAKNNTKHPAVFPIQIPLDHIKTWTNEGDIVLDPFIGSGTTALAAKHLNRKYIGIDMSQEYCDIAIERLNSEQ
jgi:site-specific DNA-methyltransferase (adenine-specific)